MGIHAAPLFSTALFTGTRAGRYVLWRTPTAGDQLRFPFLHAGEPLPADPLPDVEHPVVAGELAIPAAGAWRGGPLATLLEETASTAFVLVRDGLTLCEWFAPGVDPDAPARTLSVTKSVAALLVAQAIERGHLPGMDAPVGDIVGGLHRDVGALTLAQLMRMASGIGYREGMAPWSDDARVYHGAHLRRETYRRRVTDPVDAFFHYNDWHPLLVALALERSNGSSVPGLISRELWRPLQAGVATLSMDCERVDAMPHLESGLNASACGLARFGQLVLQRGQWEGEQVVPEACFARLDDLSDAWREPAHFGYYKRLPWGRPLSTGHCAYKDFWWHHVPRAGVHDWFAMGALGAHVYVSPDTRCVAVRLARRFPPGVWWAPILRQVVETAHSVN